MSGISGQKKRLNVITVILTAGIFLFVGIITAHALEITQSQIYTNPETGYRAVISDEAMLLSESESADLSKKMQKITEYGNAAFISVDENYLSAQSYAQNCYRELFGTASGMVFLIDMDNRMIWIHSDGAVYKTVTKSYANTITDNVYKYASDGDYYKCAAEAFGQAKALLDGQKIAQPMKYISNLLLALILALLINFGIVKYFSGLKSPSEEKILNSVRKKFTFTKPTAEFIRETKHYSPISTGSGGSSSGGGGGGHSGGGGSHSSGGGGGHSF